MAVNRLASQCPPVQVSTTFRKLLDAYNTDGGIAPASKNFQNGMGAEARMGMNENALRGDISVLCPSSPIHAVWMGLTLSFVSGGSAGGTVTVAPGQARIDGIVELASISTNNVVLEGWNYIYLTSAKVIAVITGGVLTPPASIASCFIGAVFVASGVGTIDTSGVVYAKGVSGSYRETSDPGAPSDTAPVGAAIETRTLDANYASDGSGAGWARSQPPNASTMTKGVGKLSVTAADPANPIFVGDNDPRLAQYQLIARYTTSTAPTGTIAVTGPGMYEVVCSAANDLVTLTFQQPSTLAAKLDRTPIIICKDDGASPLGNTRVRIQSTGGATVRRTAYTDITVDQGVIIIIPRIAQNDYAVISKTN